MISCFFFFFEFFCLQSLRLSSTPQEENHRHAAVRTACFAAQHLVARQLGCRRDRLAGVVRRHLDARRPQEAQPEPKEEALQVPR